MARTILEEFEFVKPSEGRSARPRFIQNVFENTEHFQINEYAANLSRLKDEGGEPAMITSIALQNPCVAPMDLYLRMEIALKESFATNKAKLGHFVEKILPQAKHWILSQIATDVYGSVLRDESVVESTWKKYTDHVRAYVHNTKVKHEVTQADVKPDERFMQTIEQYLGIPEKDVFRKELSDAIATVSHSVLLADEPRTRAPSAATSSRTSSSPARTSSSSAGSRAARAPPACTPRSRSS
jgi:serine protein kinase